MQPWAERAGNRSPECGDGLISKVPVTVLGFGFLAGLPPGPLMVPRAEKTGPDRCPASARGLQALTWVKLAPDHCPASARRVQALKRVAQWKKIPDV